MGEIRENMELLLVGVGALPSPCLYGPPERAIRDMPSLRLASIILEHLVVLLLYNYR
jgi:hypothetical protein